jgi:hypothetical protein
VDRPTTSTKISNGAPVDISILDCTSGHSPIRDRSSITSLHREVSSGPIPDGMPLSLSRGRSPSEDGSYALELRQSLATDVAALSGKGEGSLGTTWNRHWIEGEGSGVRHPEGSALMTSATSKLRSLRIEKKAHGRALAPPTASLLRRIGKSSLYDPSQTQKPSGVCLAPEGFVRALA